MWKQITLYMNNSLYFTEEDAYIKMMSQPGVAKEMT